MREESKKPSRFLGKTGFIVIIIECSWLWLHCDLFAEKESTLLATAVSVSVSKWYDSITYIIHSTHTLEYASENERVTSLFLQYLNYFFLSRWVELSQVQSEWKNHKIKSEREWKTFESIRASVHMLSSECVSFYQYVRCLINWIPMFAFEISICIAHTSHTRLNYYRNKIRFLVNFLKALRHATFVCNDSTCLKVIIYCSVYVFGSKLVIKLIVVCIEICESNENFSCFFYLMCCCRRHTKITWFNCQQWCETLWLPKIPSITCV